MFSFCAPSPQEDDDEKLEDFVENVCPRHKDGVLKWCENNGIDDVDELKELAKRCWLGEYSPDLPVRAALLIEKHFDHQKQGERKWWHVAEDMEAMSAILSNYGIVAALVLTLTVSAFGGMTVDEWDTWTDNVSPYSLIMRAKREMIGRRRFEPLHRHRMTTWLHKLLGTSHQMDPR